MLFGVTAPRAVRPALGAMTGWDENFDKKFDLATKLDIGGPGRALTENINFSAFSLYP
jgi:hypothetical protein